MAQIYRFKLANGEYEFTVYVGNKLIRTCPSLGMAQEVAAGL